MADQLAQVSRDVKEVDDFLSKVEEIEAVIKGLNNEDENVRDGAVVKADHMLKALEQKKKKIAAPDRTGVNRTVINTKAFQDGPSERGEPAYTENMEQAAFMGALEQDAARRYEDKQRRQKIADKLKDEGNIEFKAGNYQKAIDLYTQAREQVKDCLAVYTNRAQAYIKIKEYHKAIEDCEWALRVTHDCIKAYVHKGRAYLGLKDYEQAMENFKKVLEINPNKKQIVNEYIAEVELAKLTEEQEKNAKEFLDQGTPESATIAGVLEKVNKTDQLPLYYSGGLRLLCSLLIDTNQRTLFRTSGGFQLTTEHPTIVRCMADSKGKLSNEEADLCWSFLDMCCAACEENEENQKKILELEKLPDQMLGILENKAHGRKALKESVINLLHCLSMSEIGRARLTGTFQLPRLLTSLMIIMKMNGRIASNAVGFLNNISLDKKFKKQMRGNIEEEVLPAFESLMTVGAENLSVLPVCISSITNLCEDAHIRIKLSRRRETWIACCCVLEKLMKNLNSTNNQLVCQAALGLLMNMSLEKTDQLKEFSVRLTGTCCHLMSGALKERAMGLLSHLLPKSTEGANKAVELQAVPAFMSVLEMDPQNQTETKFAIKCLSACTAVNKSARNEVIKSKKGLLGLYSQIESKDESVIGNTALCLGHCVDMVGSEASKFVQTNAIMDLLTLARDCKSETVQQNCAILIAKLVKGDQRHLERLRELHGVEILHTCMKNLP